MPASSARRSGAMPGSRSTTSTWSGCSPRAASSRTRCAPACSTAPRSAISFVNWEDPDGHGEIRLRRGTLGETRLTPQGYFHAELRGLSQPLAQSTLEVFSPNCRADLGDERCKFPIEPPELGRDQAVSEGAFYRVPTAAGTGSARYEDRIYEVIEAGTTASSQPAYDTTIGATTTDGTATLKAYDSFTRVAWVEAVTDHRIFTVSEELSGFADGWFDEGAVTFETGANAGRTIEVKSWTQAIRRLELWAPTGLACGGRATSCGSTPAATSACSRTAGTGSGFRAASCSTRATPGTSGASRTCPGARSRPCRRVGADALGAHLLDRPVRADRRRRLRLRSDRRGGRRAARRLPVRLQRTEDRGAAPWRPRGQLLDLWRRDPGRVRGPEGRGRDDLGDRHRRGQEHQEGRRQPVRRRPEDRRVPVFRELRGRVRRGAGRRGPADLGRRQADRGSARGRRRLRQPPQVQFPDLPGHRGPGAGPADPAARRGQATIATARRDAGVPGPGLHRVRGSAARRVRQPHPADHRGDRLGGRAAGGGQGHDVPVGDRLFHQQRGPRFGAGVSLLQDVAGRDRSHSHLRHGRGPAGARDRARHRPRAV